MLVKGILPLYVPVLFPSKRIYTLPLKVDGSDSEVDQGELLVVEYSNPLNDPTSIVEVRLLPTTVNDWEAEGVPRLVLNDVNVPAILREEGVLLPFIFISCTYTAELADANRNWVELPEFTVYVYVAPVDPIPVNVTKSVQVLLIFCCNLIVRSLDPAAR